MRITFAIAVFFNAIASMVAFAQAPPPELASREAAALAARMKINTFHLELVLTGTGTIHKNGDFQHHYECDYDGTRLRIIRRVIQKDRSFSDARYDTHIMCWNCPEPGKLYYHIAHTTRLSIDPTEGDTHPVGYRDFRLLGYCHGAYTMRTHKIHDNIQAADRRDFTITKTRHGEHDAIQFFYRQPSKNNDGTKMWIVPTQDDNVVKFTSSGKMPDGTPWTMNTESELIQHDDTGIWFPKHVFYSQRGTKSSDFEDHVEVLKARFNQPIDPILFKPESFNLSNGLGVIDRTKPGSKEAFWDASRNIVMAEKPARMLGTPKSTIMTKPKEPIPPELAIHLPSPTGNVAVFLRWIYAAVALMAAIAAITVLFRFRKSA